MKKLFLLLLLCALKIVSMDLPDDLISKNVPLPHASFLTNFPDVSTNIFKAVKTTWCDIFDEIPNDIQFCRDSHKRSCLFFIKDKLFFYCSLIGMNNTQMDVFYDKLRLWIQNNPRFMIIDFYKGPDFPCILIGPNYREDEQEE